MKPRDAANAERARAQWFVVPDWVSALADACDSARSQQRVAEQLGVSSAMVNQVLGNLYKGDLAKIETRVRGELMNETVDCPVIGALSKRECLDNHLRPFSGAISTRRRMFARACPGCPHNTKRAAS